jgi:peptidoglycan-associated lipoprotein
VLGYWKFNFYLEGVMNIWRVAAIGLFSLTLMACACSKKAGKGDGAGEGAELPTAEGDGPLKDINFAFDSSALTSAAQATLRDNAKYLLDNPSVNVTVEGHCDERGTNEYNMALGERRAKAAANFLKSLGVAGSRLSTISYGEEMPLVPGSNEAAWSKNRRAHFRVN